MPASRIYNPSVADGGGGGGSDPVAIEIMVASFNYNDSSPKSLFSLPAGTKILTCQIIIQSDFNDAAATLSVGDSGDDDRYMQVQENVPSASGEYEANRYYLLPGVTTIELKITPGTSTQGSGQVVIEYKQP